MNANDPGEPPPRRRIWVGVLDQAASSGSNFLVLLMVARVSDVADFGSFAVFFGVFAAALGLGRAAIGAPLSLDIPTLSTSDQGRFLGKSVTSALLLGCGVGASLAIVAAAVPMSGDLRLSLLIIAAASPLIFVQDTLRYAAVAIAKPGLALISDGIWSVSAAVVAAGSVMGKWNLTQVEAVVAWVCGAVLGTLVLALYFRDSLKPRSGTIAWFRADRRRLYLSLDSVLAFASPVAVSVITALLAGDEVVGAIRGSSTLFGPLNAVLASIMLTLIPEMVDRPVKARRTFTYRAAGAIIVLIVIWGLALYVTPGAFGSKVLGSTWDQAHAIVLITAAEYVGAAMWTTAGAYLQSTGRSKQVLFIRVGYTVTSVGACTLVASMDGTAAGIAAALALIALTVGFVSFAIVRVVE
jgi:O-antigen/teichoic acid export membrane protein